MTAPVRLRRAAALFGAICLCAGFASASAASDGAMTVAQNLPVQIPPNAAPPAPGEENKEHNLLP